MSKMIHLVVFDLDGTLTKVESTWQYIHERLGTWDIGRMSAQDYRKGRISYVKWAQLDSFAWRGVTLKKMRSIVIEIPYFDGTREAISGLRKKGKLSGIVSAGISLLSDRVREELCMDFAIANELHFSQGRMTGEVTVNVSLDGKGQVIRRVAKQLGFSLNECAVVGDNSFDLPRGAGLRIGFNPKHEAERACDVVIRGTDIRAILAHIP